MSHIQKLRIGILMGGRSIEKEVSFNSGRTVCDHLDSSLYTIIPLFQNENSLYVLPWHFLHRGKTSDFVHRLQQEANMISWDHLKNIVDFMYIALHGQFAEDGIIQGFLEILNIPYLGSKVLSSALSMNKVIQKKILQAAGICVPKSIYVTPSEITRYNKNKLLLYLFLKKNTISFPVIVKPNKEGSSLGISYVKKKEHLFSALIKAMTISEKKQQPVLIEEYIKGREFTCIVLTDNNNNYTPLVPTEIIPEKNSYLFDYEQKYMPGRAIKFTPARFSNDMITKIQSVCTTVMRTLNFKTFGRIDGFVTEDGVVFIIDPNTLSGMGPSSFIFNQAAEHNMNHTQFINYLVNTELQSYGIKRNMNENENITNKVSRLKVAVLFGGASNEREISLESGRNVVYKLSTKMYESIPIFVDQQMLLYKINNAQLVRNTTKEIKNLITKNQLLLWNDLPNIADFVFIALHGGKGEDGSIQGALEMLNLPYNGSSVLCSALCMNKFKANTFLHNEGFYVPKHILLNKNIPFNIESIVSQVPLPVIVKPHNDGCSMFVKKATTKKELFTAIQEIFTQKKYAFIEEYIIGTELTVGVIGNTNPLVLPPSLVVRKNDILSLKEKFLPGSGENQTPAPLSKSALQLITNTIKQVYIALDCKGYARIDCFYQTKKQSPTNQERVVIIEINTLPALTPATCLFHQAAEIGMLPMDFITTIITLGMQEHNGENNTKKCSSIQKSATYFFSDV